MSSHDFDQLLIEHQNFVQDRDWHQFHTPKNMATCIAVEAAELLAHYTWHIDGKPSNAPGTEAPDTALIAAEAADVFLSLIGFCSVANIDLLAASKRKLQALGAKYPVELARGSAVKDPTAKVD